MHIMYVHLYAYPVSPAGFRALAAAIEARRESIDSPMYKGSLLLGCHHHPRISSLCVCARVPFVYKPSANVNIARLIPWMRDIQPIARACVYYARWLWSCQRYAQSST